MKKLVIEFSNERLITPGGLSLVGQMLGKSNFIKKWGYTSFLHWTIDMEATHNI